MSFWNLEFTGLKAVIYDATFYTGVDTINLSEECNSKVCSNSATKQHKLLQHALSEKPFNMINNPFERHAAICGNKGMNSLVSEPRVLSVAA